MPFVLEAGRTVGGRYVLERLLGAGGMGQVWAARDPQQDAAVAIKFLRDGGGTDEAHARLLKEARASQVVRHPAIVPVDDVITSDEGEPALVMALLQGETLSARRVPMAPAEVARLLLPVAEALAAAHAVGIVHRDVKPENVFITSAGAVKVLDFGIAKRIEVDADAAASAGTKTGVLMGTPLFMSPEQIFAEKDIDHRTDIWSLGLIHYQCLAGVLPTQAESLGQVLKNILTADFRSLRELAPEVPVELAALVDRMLRRKREARPRSMAEVASVLAALAREGAHSNDLVIKVGAPESRDGWADTQVRASASSALSGDSTDSFLRAIVARPGTAAMMAEPELTGQRIAHYQVSAKIGQGGMGIVYAAEDVRLRRRVALKVLPMRLVTNEDRRRRFLREARSASQVHHANVATIFDVGESEGTVYIAMEHVAGRTLRDVLAEGKLDQAKAVDIALQMARGLARAHDAGVIHRDIKPENVMIAPDGTAKLLDFGLAKLSSSAGDEHTEGDAAAGDELASRAGRIMGTPGYMSPEQASGGLVDARTDVYAMGVVIHEMVTGARPSGSAAPGPRPRLDARLDRIVSRCLRPAPGERYASGPELADELSALHRALSEAGRRPLRTVLVSAVLAASAVGVMAWWLDRPGTEAAAARAPVAQDVQLATVSPTAAAAAPLGSAPEPAASARTASAPVAMVGPSSSVRSGTPPRAARVAAPSAAPEPAPVVTGTASARTGLQRAVATAEPF